MKLKTRVKIWGREETLKAIHSEFAENEGTENDYIQRDDVLNI